MFSTLKGALPDFQIEIGELLADGDYVLVKSSSSGTHSGEMMGFAATGRRISWGAINLIRFAGGQIVEVWANEDLLSMSQQLSGTSGASAGA
jgi:predicted ester cyclase